MLYTMGVFLLFMLVYKYLSSFVNYVVFSGVPVCFVFVYFRFLMGRSIKYNYNNNDHLEPCLGLDQGVDHRIQCSRLFAVV